MQFHSVLQITDEEARTYLAEHYASMLTADPQHTLKMIKNGELSIPKIPNMSEEDVVQEFGELGVGLELAKKHNVSHVVFASDDYKWEVLFDIENVPPSQRWGIWKKSETDTENH